MHYANGRPAHNGDIALQLIYGKPAFGVVYNAKPGNDYCNGDFAPLGGGPHVGCCFADCLHIDDVLAVLNIKLGVSDVRAQLAKVPQSSG